MIGRHNNVTTLNNRNTSFRSQPYALSRGSFIQSPSNRDRSFSPNNKNNYFSNSYASLNSEINRMPEDLNLYPAGFGDLLKNEDRNIKAFKLQVNKEKDKVDEDMQSFKVELNHTLEDLRLSLHAHLDRVYQIYLDKTAKFKTELFDINRLKEELELELGASSLSEIQAKLSRDRNIPERDTNQNYSSQYVSYPNISKLNNTILQQKIQTISNMETGNKELKKYYILNHIAEMQKERMFPLTDLQRELIVLNTYENGFYQSKEFLKVLSNLRDLMSREVKNVYDNNNRYIRDIDSISRKEDFNGTRVLDALNISGLGQPPHVSSSIMKSHVPQMPNHYTTNINRSIGSPLHGTISLSSQSLRTNSTEQINIIEEPLNIKLPNNVFSQTALCGTYINNQIALGLKDGTIQIFSRDGFNIATLKEQKANICSLAVIRSGNQNYLVSGSDAGCSRVVVWDPVTWQPRHVFGGHTAAVTGIVDLQDGVHFVSAGYDKKLNIYSLEQGKLVYEAPQCESPITGLVINSNGTRIVACGLHKVLFVFRIGRDSRLRANNLIQERKIQNNAIICSMVCSQIVPELLVISTKDSKIKLVNIDKGESYKTIPFTNSLNESETYPLEMTLIERDNKSYYPLAFIWTSKEHKIYQVNTETTLVSIKNLGMGSGALEYGYGVSPKCFYVPDNTGALIYCVNQESGRNNNCATVLRLEDMR